MSSCIFLLHYKKTLSGHQKYLKEVFSQIKHVIACNSTDLSFKVLRKKKSLIAKFSHFMSQILITPI